MKETNRSAKQNQLSPCVFADWYVSVMFDCLKRKSDDGRTPVQSERGWKSMNVEIPRRGTRLIHAPLIGTKLIIKSSPLQSQRRGQLAS